MDILLSHIKSFLDRSEVTKHFHMLEACTSCESRTSISVSLIDKHFHAASLALQNLSAHVADSLLPCFSFALQIPLAFEPSKASKMPVSSSKAARQAKRAEKKEKTPTASKKGSKANSVNGDTELQDADEIDAVNSDKGTTNKLEKLALQEDASGLSDRVTTGVLASMPSSRDVKITSASLVFHGKVLFTDTTLEVTYGRRYGLLGENGCGKSTLLKAIDKREYPFPEHIDIYLLNEGAPKSDDGALEWVVRQAENEVKRLETLSEKILEEDGPESPVLQDIYDVSVF